MLRVYFRVCLGSVSGLCCFCVGSASGSLFVATGSPLTVVSVCAIVDYPWYGISVTTSSPRFGCNHSSSACCIKVLTRPSTTPAALSSKLSSNRCVVVRIRSPRAFRRASLGNNPLCETRRHGFADLVARSLGPRFPPPSPRRTSIASRVLPTSQQSPLLGAR